jgi:PBSX family phage terminase large subunit
MITFNKKLFNPNFWHFRTEMNNPSRRFICGYGSSSSAKTYSFTQSLVIKLLEGDDCIIFRKVSTTIDDTIYKDFKDVIASFKLNDYFKLIKHRIVCLVNGKDIAFKGLDDEEKIKGISHKRVYCNELNAFEEAEFNQIRKRLRGHEGQQILFDFNPIDKEHWIKKSLFDNYEHNPLPLTLEIPNVPIEYTEITEKWENNAQDIKMADGEIIHIEPNFVCIKSTYLNNFWVVGSPDKTFGFVDEQTIADFERDRDYDFNFYNVYALGNWGTIRVGGEFYKKFNPNTNIKSFPYDPTLPLHISFDFNVNPGMHVLIMQVRDKLAWQVDEIRSTSPKNNTEGACNEFMFRYQNHKGGLFIYGDASGRSQDTRSEEGHNDYTIIERKLRDFHPTLRVPYANPSVKLRGDFINHIFYEGYDGIEVYFNPKCTITIEDFQNTKEASDGTKLKEKVKHPITKVPYEKYAHLTDCFDYFITEAFKKEYIKYQGESSLKPGGTKIVHRSPSVTL